MTTPKSEILMSHPRGRKNFELGPTIFGVGGLGRRPSDRELFAIIPGGSREPVDEPSYPMSAGPKQK
jgi:hypothetical protein